jgi:archaeal flagellar protein FlaF
MGFETILATGISIMILMVLAYVLFAGFTGSIAQMTNTMKDVETLKGDQMKTSISVYNVSTNDTLVTFEMSNNGFTRIENFSQIDIIMTFTELPSSQYEDEQVADQNSTVWFPYEKNLANDKDAWTCVDITPDMINPRVWDPGETMSCQMYIKEKLQPGSLGWVVVTAPNGASGMRYFYVKI